MNSRKPPPFDDAELRAMFEARAIELSGTWRTVWSGHSWQHQSDLCATVDCRVLCIACGPYRP